MERPIVIGRSSTMESLGNKNKRRGSSRDSNKSRGGGYFLNRRFVVETMIASSYDFTERERERFEDEGYRMTLIPCVDLSVDTLARNNSFDDSLQNVS